MGLAVPSNGIFLQMIRSIRNILHLTLYMSYSSEIKLNKLQHRMTQYQWQKLNMIVLLGMSFSNLFIIQGKNLIREKCQHDNVRSVRKTCNLRMSKNCTLVQFSEPLTLKIYLLLYLTLNYWWFTANKFKNFSVNQRKSISVIFELTSRKLEIH